MLSRIIFDYQVLSACVKAIINNKLLLGPLAYVFSCEIKDREHLDERKFLSNIKIGLTSISLGNHGSKFELERIREKKFWVTFIDILSLAFPWDNSMFTWVSPQPHPI